MSDKTAGKWTVRYKNKRLNVAGIDLDSEPIAEVAFDYADSIVEAMNAAEARRSTGQWMWATKMLPPYAVEVFETDGSTVCRWEGDLLDELGIRQKVEQYAERIVSAVNSTEPGSAPEPPYANVRFAHL